MMVNARIHIICGNCGSKDLYYSYSEYPEEDYDPVYLKCTNCSTLHFPSEYNERQEEMKEGIIPKEEKNRWEDLRKKVENYLDNKQPKGK